MKTLRWILYSITGALLLAILADYGYFKFENWLNGMVRDRVTSELARHPPQTTFVIEGDNPVVFVKDSFVHLSGATTEIREE